MLSRVTLEEMERMLRNERHYARDEELKRDAQMYCAQLDQRLDQPLSVYAREGRCTEFSFGDMSLLTIRSLRRCGFLEAAVLMDAYLKDPAAGLARITRR